MLARFPAPGTYSFDGGLYLRTYSAMKGGVGYYQAFRQAVIDDARHDASFLTSPFNYREPLVFELWRVLPGDSPHALFGWFVVWSLIGLVAAYAIAESLVPPGVALLAPIALLRFFNFFWWADRTWFTITEVWAVVFALGAIALLVRRRFASSVLLLVLAVAARELYIVLIPAWIIAWWLLGGAQRRRAWWIPVASVLGSAAVLAAHLLSVPALAAGGSGLVGWLHGGPARLLDALWFGWEPTAHGSSWLPLVLAAAALVGAARATPNWRRGALLAATVLPTLFLAALSGGASWLYWGAIYTPIAAAIAPAALRGLLREPSPASAGEQGLL